MDIPQGSLTFIRSGEICNVVGLSYYDICSSLNDTHLQYCILFFDVEICPVFPLYVSDCGQSIISWETA